jgi:Fic family protein
MATYERTHPWLQFQLHLDRAPWDFWLMAGEATSKCEHLAGVALRPEAALELMQVYLIKGALATTAIEGNTLTEEQVRQRIAGTLELPPSKEYLGIEVDNIVDASNRILDGYRLGTSPTLSPELIQQFNRDVLRNLKLESHVIPGALRVYSVGVADYRGAPAPDLDGLLARLCKWLAEPWLKGVESLRVADAGRLEAIFKAVIAHLYLAWIHPFGDGNGRTARLVEFFILVQGGVPAPAAHLLSNHYNETRSEYYRQLSYASKSGGDVIPFCKYAIRGLVDQLREQIERIRDQQLRLFWQNHVHQILGDSETGRRRRYLVLDLAKQPQPISKAKLPEVSVRVFRHYVGKDEKTLSRDLKELEKLELVQRVGERYRAKTEVVRAYMTPVRADALPARQNGSAELPTDSRSV